MRESGRKREYTHSSLDLYNSSPVSSAGAEKENGAEGGNYLHTRIGNRSRADTGRQLIN